MHCLLQNVKRQLTIGLTLIMLLALPALAGKPVPVVSPTEKVGGLTQADYAVRWWQWANRVPQGVKPYQDPTGSQCSLNQSGDVWFLAGTDGTYEIIRNCKIPIGKYIYFPVIAMLVHAVPGKPLTCEQARAQAADNNNHLLHTVVKIDGHIVKNIEHNRVRSRDCFDAFPQAPYIKKPASYFPAATDGYWLMLKPLSPGLHRISVKARYDNPGSEFGDLEQIFEYRLLVENEKTLDKKPSRPARSIEGVIVSR